MVLCTSCIADTLSYSTHSKLFEFPLLLSTTHYSVLSLFLPLSLCLSFPHTHTPTYTHSRHSPSHSLTLTLSLSLSSTKTESLRAARVVKTWTESADVRKEKMESRAEVKRLQALKVRTYVRTYVRSR